MTMLGVLQVSAAMYGATVARLCGALSTYTLFKFTVAAEAEQCEGVEDLDGQAHPTSLPREEHRALSFHARVYRIKPQQMLRV